MELIQKYGNKIEIKTQQKANYVQLERWWTRDTKEVPYICSTHSNQNRCRYSSCLDLFATVYPQVVFLCALITTFFHAFSAPSLCTMVFFAEKLSSSFIHFCVLQAQNFVNIGNKVNSGNGTLLPPKADDQTYIVRWMEQAASLQDHSRILLRLVTQQRHWLL